MTSPVIEVPDMKVDKPAQMLEDTWTTPALLLNGQHAVLPISRDITRLSHLIVLMMATDRLILSAFKNLLKEAQILALTLVNLLGPRVAQPA
jgi:hypothetical protein